MVAAARRTPLSGAARRVSNRTCPRCTRDRAALGLGVLAKGPVGAILPLASIVIFMIVEASLARSFSRCSIPARSFSASAIASSWYLACYFGGRFAFLNRQLDTENVGRFFGSLGAMAPWYYLKPVLLNSAPLSLLVPIAAVYALLSPIRHFRPRQFAPLLSSRQGDRASAVRLFAIFYFATVIFFSIAAYKRRSYLLPVWPPSP